MRILKSVSPNQFGEKPFKLSIKLLTLRLDFSNSIYKMSSQNWKFFFQKKKEFYVSSDLSARHNKNQRKASNVGHLVRGA